MTTTPEAVDLLRQDIVQALNYIAFNAHDADTLQGASLEQTRVFPWCVQSLATATQNIVPSTDVIIEYNSFYTPFPSYFETLGGEPYKTVIKKPGLYKMISFVITDNIDYDDVHAIWAYAYPGVMSSYNLRGRQHKSAVPAGLGISQKSYYVFDAIGVTSGQTCEVMTKFRHNSPSNQNVLSVQNYDPLPAPHFQPFLYISRESDLSSPVLPP